MVLQYLPSPDGHGEDIRQELAAMGHSVFAFAFRRRNLLYKNKGIKELYIRWIMGRLLATIQRIKPDVVFVMKGETLPPGLIHEAKRRTGAVIVNIFPDNPLLMIPFGRIEAYDLFCVKDRYAIQALEKAGLRNLYYLPHHCTPSFHHHVEPTPAEAKIYGSDLSFVGHWYPYRDRFFADLEGFHLKIWGKDWWRSPSPVVRRAWQGRPAFEREKLLVYGATKISLNLHHPLNDIVGINDRVFELAACRAFQLVDWKEDLPNLFKEGEEIVSYRSKEELCRLANHYLAHPDERAAIAANAQARAYRDHTCAQRLTEILHVVRQRFGKGV